jgi:hypothetical protein
MAMSNYNPVAETVARFRKSMFVAFENGLHKLVFDAMSSRCRVIFHGASEALARDLHHDTVEWVGQFEAR